MRQIRIETDGLTLREARELEEIVQGFEEVADTQVWPFAPGTMHYRSLPTTPQASLPPVHVVVHLTEIGTAAAKGIAIAAGAHLYKKVGESIVDRAWNTMKVKFSGKSVVDVGVKLYGADGELIKEIKGKR
jgi:hypothetical protein